MIVIEIVIHDQITVYEILNQSNTFLGIIIVTCSFEYIQMAQLEEGTLLLCITQSCKEYF
jgi:hypothetical protein